MTHMAANSTLLCIHRDPGQLDLLQENGYELATATNGSEGLRLFMSQHVDAVILEYYLGLLDGAATAAEIRRVRPLVPIIMIADHVEIPSHALKSVDALVVKSDGPHFLLATVHFFLNVLPAKSHERARLKPSTHLRRPSRSRGGTSHSSPSIPGPVNEENDAPFSREIWRGIRNGTIQI